MRHSLSPQKSTQTPRPLRTISATALRPQRSLRRLITFSRRGTARRVRKERGITITHASWLMRGALAASCDLRDMLYSCGPGDHGRCWDAPLRHRWRFDIVRGRGL